MFNTAEQVLEITFGYAFGIVGGLLLAFIAVVFLICMAAIIVRELFG